MSDPSAPPPQTPAGDYSIGSTVWPGLSKLIEEAGELQQVAGKLIGAGGVVEHWDGTNLRERMTEELADLVAAVHFFVEASGLDNGAILNRSADKLAKFRMWHRDG